MKARTACACAALTVMGLACCDRPAPGTVPVAPAPVQVPVATPPQPIVAPATPTDAPASAVELDRIGALVVGEAFTPGPAPAPWEGSGKHPEVDCEHYDRGTLPVGVSMMVIDGRIARFELHEPDEGTRGPFGLHAGMTRAAVEAALPKGMQVSQHKYGDAGDVYLDWYKPGAPHGVRAEIWDGKADAVFWGDRDAIQLVEGCS